MSDRITVKEAFDLSHTREITTNRKIPYLPIYDGMFWGKSNKLNPNKLTTR